MTWRSDPRDLASPAELVGAADQLGRVNVPITGRTARYSRWDGSQASPGLAPGAVLDELTESLMEHGDVDRALGDLLQRGIAPGGSGGSGLPGLRELQEEVDRRRRERLGEGTLDDLLGELRRDLDDIVAQERESLVRQGERGDDARPAAAQRQAALDALPEAPGDRLRALRDYDFHEPGAQERFDQLVDRLRRQLLSGADGLAGLTGSGPAGEGAAGRDGLRELNQLLEGRLAGGQPDPSGFLARYGGGLPGRGFDELISQLGDQLGGIRSLLRSAPEAWRAELESVVDALLRDTEHGDELGRLRANLDRALPDDAGRRYAFAGERPLSLAEALQQIEQLQALDQLGALLEGMAPPGDLSALDRERITKLLGEEAARLIDALEQAAQGLEAAGLVEREGERLRLTPSGSRRIGQAVLADLFGSLDRDAFGGHRLERSGRGGDRSEATKPYEYGDPFAPDLRATLFNALARSQNAPSERGGAPIRLDPGDFEVYRSEQLTSTSTVLLLDLSRSMLLRRCYVSAKKVAIALDTLIRAQFPRDYLGVVGFSATAREIAPEELAALTWRGNEYGTNLQHGLQLARRMLARRRSANREIIVITDGEPTAHMQNGRVEFSYPPTMQTTRETLREVGRCTRDGITINTFMLDKSPALADFVGQVTRLNRGRAFYATPERLGRYLLVDFVARRTRRIG